MKITEIRRLSDSELVARKKEACQEQFNLRLQQKTGALEKPSRLNDLRKDVAKIETVLSERRLSLNLRANDAIVAAADSKKKTTISK